MAYGSPVTLTFNQVSTSSLTLNLYGGQFYFYPVQDPNNYQAFQVKNAQGSDPVQLKSFGISSGAIQVEFGSDGSFQIVVGVTGDSDSLSINCGLSTGEIRVQSAQGKSDTIKVGDSSADIKLDKIAKVGA